MSDPTRGALGCQLARARQQLQQAPGLPFAQHLPAHAIHATLRRVGGAFRQRLYTPALTLWVFLSQLLDPDHSCRQAVARLLAWLVARGRAPCSARTGAYCKARARLPEGAAGRPGPRHRAAGTRRGPARLAVAGSGRQGG